MGKEGPSLEDLLRQIDEILTPELVAEMARRRPKTFGDGLEILLADSEEVFTSVIPQVYDQQTQLPAKIYFERRLVPRAIARSEREDIPVSYLLIDLDDFHAFNDRYGRQTGDEAIGLFAELLRNQFRTRDRIGNVTTHDEERRISDRRSVSLRDEIGNVDSYSQQGRVGGGEEFAVILYGVNETTALTKAKRFLDEVRKIQIHYVDSKLGITASIGVAQYEKGITPQELMRRAELAERHSKKLGRDQATAYSQINS